METDRAPVLASYGAGTNSTALLIEWVNRGYPLDATLFADTGGERDETYRYHRDVSNLARKIRYAVRFAKEYPLIEWGWGRDECHAAIAAAGLPSPGKSACFFCPSSKLHEIRALPADLQRRALAMEDGAAAGLTSAKGLGRSFAWRSVLEAAPGCRLPEAPISTPCECTDGDSDDD